MSNIRAVELTVAECDETGEIGLVMPMIEDNLPNDYGMFVSYQARIVAHDIVEHMGSDEIGGCADEIRALGCVYFTRVETGVLFNTGFTRGPMLASDVCNVLRDDYNADIHLSGQSFERDSYSKVHEDTRKELRNVAVHGVAEYRDELELEDDEYNEFSVKDSAWSVYRLLVSGYARAMDLYECSYHAYSLFQAVESAIEPVFKEIDESMVGATFRLDLNIESGFCMCERNWEEEEDERTCNDCAEYVQHDHGWENQNGYFQCFNCQCAEEIKDYTRQDIIEQLEGEFSIACYDDESTTLLRETLAENLADNKRDEV